MRAAAALGLVFLASAAWSQNRPLDARAFAAIDVCVARLTPGADIGYARIAARCPELATRLEQSSLSAWLPRGWKDAHNDLSAGSLSELRMLAQRNLAMRLGSHQPRVARLQAVLADLESEGSERATLWARFRSWLRLIVERSNSSDKENGLARMIGSKGSLQTVLELLTYIGVGLVIILAISILIHEIRAARPISARARALTGGVQSYPRRRPSLSWRDVERAPLAQKPSMLIALIVLRLAAAGRIKGGTALTLRELERQVRLPAPIDHERLRAIVAAAESVRFGARQPASEVLHAGIEQGRELLESLQAQVKPA